MWLLLVGVGLDSSPSGKEGEGDEEERDPSLRRDSSDASYDGVAGGSLLKYDLALPGRLVDAESPPNSEDDDDLRALSGVPPPRLGVVIVVVAVAPPFLTPPSLPPPARGGVLGVFALPWLWLWL